METRAKRSISASLAGLKRLEEKRLMSGKTAETIGGLAGVSRSLAQKFFKGEPISVENFQSLCRVLDLKWEEIVESEAINSSVTTRKRVAFVIEGSLDDLDPTKLAKLQAMVRALKQLTGDASMTTVDVEEGSIRLILEGSEAVEKLKQLFDAGELAEVLGTPVRDVELIESDFLDVEEVKEDRLKTLLVAAICSQGASKSDLSRSDLSNTDLNNTNLSGVNLSNADLSNADLSNANLNGANLSRADLSNADLSNANLNGANLKNADLSNVDLEGANLKNADVSDIRLSKNIVVAVSSSKNNSEQLNYDEQLRQEFGDIIDSLDLQQLEKSYLKSRWLDQVLVMEKRAGKMLNRHRSLRLNVIIFSALLPIIVAFSFNQTTEIDKILKTTFIAMSTIITASSAIDEFYRYYDRWYGYRKVAESLRQQGWHFLQLTGSYRIYKTHSEAFTIFAETVEEIIRSDVETSVTGGQTFQMPPEIHIEER